MSSEIELIHPLDLSEVIGALSGGEVVDIYQRNDEQGPYIELASTGKLYRQDLNAPRKG